MTGNSSARLLRLSFGSHVIFNAIIIVTSFSHYYDYYYLHNLMVVFGVSMIIMIVMHAHGTITSTIALAVFIRNYRFES